MTSSRRRARRLPRARGRTTASSAFFRAFTPVDELALLRDRLAPGAPPGRARTTCASLRAIPWVFAWTQNRCLLPAWYGCGTALAGRRRSRGAARGSVPRLAVLPRARRERRDEPREVEPGIAARLPRPRARRRDPTLCRADRGRARAHRRRACSRSSRRASCSTATLPCSARSACATPTSTRSTRSRSSCCAACATRRPTRSASGCAPAPPLDRRHRRRARNTG